MGSVVVAVVSSLASFFRARRALYLEILGLRHQLAVYQRSARRPRLQPADRLLWAWLARAWSGWQGALVVVQPRTVIAWQRRRFRAYWTRLSRHATPGRPRLAKELRGLIRTMSTANPMWGSPRIVGELRMLGITVAKKATVERYMVRHRKPPSPTWRTFLVTHAKDLVSMDFFTVATVRFEILFVLVILAHTYVTFLGLLVVTGMRMSEALKLDRPDVDLRAGILTIRRTKFGKSRPVPLHPSSRDALEAYAARRDTILPGRSTPAFFVSERGTRLTEWRARATFATISRQIGLRAPAGGQRHGRGPRLHDMRHRFAARTLIDWYRTGIDVERAMPKLATSLGHVHVRDTYWYLEGVPELLQLATARLVEQHTEGGS